MRTRPSSIRRSSPGVTALKISGWGSGVSACRAGANEVADPIEETETVVCGEVSARVEANGAGARKRVWGDDGAGGVLCSVDAVAIARQRENIRFARHVLRHGVMMPADGLDKLKKFDAIYFGAVGAPDVPDHITPWGLPILRPWAGAYVEWRRSRGNDRS